MTDPLIASVAFRENFSNAWKKRQTPTRIPYSCQAQLGRSGSSGCPYGGGSTVRGIARSIDHSSTLTMVHTATRAPPGSLSGGRSTMAEYGTRSFGCIRYYISRGLRALSHAHEEYDMPKFWLFAVLFALATSASAQTVGFATLPPGAILHAQASLIAKVVQDHSKLQVRVIGYGGDAPLLDA